MDNSKNRQVGVNRLGKNIRKSPLHQPNFSSNDPRQQPQPQVYNISKNDFRNMVQRLTGSPSHNPFPIIPPQNPPKPQSMRLQRIRPPPLKPMNQPHNPHSVPIHISPPPVPYNDGMVRPAQFAQPHPPQIIPLTPGDSFWANAAAESPISAYMRYLQNSINNPTPRGNLTQSPLQSQVPGHIQAQQAPQPAALWPNPPVPFLPSPRIHGPVPLMPNLSSPQLNGHTVLPSPTSQFLLPSPTNYLNFLSPLSTHPFPSPGVQFSPQLTPNFSFSPMAHSGVLGPGPHPPLSPRIVFPMSPPGFFPISSPRWRD